MQDQTIKIDARVGHLHFIDDATGDVIRSYGGRIEGVLDGKKFSVIVGKSWLNLLSRIRVVSRLLRIHRINVLRVSKTKLLIIYMNEVFVYELPTRTLTKVYRFPLTHYVHTQSISVHEGRIVIGEYGNIGRSKSVGALISLDGGTTWNYKSLFEQGLVKNILAIRYDVHDQHYWIFTGDSNSESGIYLFDQNFKLQKTVGIGLAFRAISSFHLADKVVWLTNNPFGTSKVQTYDRSSGTTSTGQSLPGPVWYSTQLGTNVYCCTAAEDVAGDAGDHVYVLQSCDYIHWDVLYQFKKDRMNKRLFLYGLGTFPQMGETNSMAYLNLDAVEDFDGCVIQFKCPVVSFFNSELP
ncbi:hypothetical protein H8K47_13305 [Undibacterium sp. CY7W]|uniref:Uncharacterized protein n=1 Tax=Undibacterium rugosum TaxID=2762291 RepID=A0A923IA40_9BURK|nr:hypothetical protein [Undibacterium rugosum]MBC3936343.1 hypothetical protein [Undibacterium rugosum]